MEVLGRHLRLVERGRLESLECERSGVEVISVVSGQDLDLLEGLRGRGHRWAVSNAKDGHRGYRLSHPLQVVRGVVATLRVGLEAGGAGVAWKKMRKVTHSLAQTRMAWMIWNHSTRQAHSEPIHRPLLC